MRAAVFSVTRRGAELSKRIAKAFPDGWDVTRFCFERYPADGAEPFANLAQKTAEVFPECGAVVFVCACGIAVRAVAPLIKSKQTDPAVVVLDDCGKFAVSLLSGHLGGANRMSGSGRSTAGHNHRNRRRRKVFAGLLRGCKRSDFQGFFSRKGTRVGGATRRENMSDF